MTPQDEKEAIRIPSISPAVDTNHTIVCDVNPWISWALRNITAGTLPVPERGARMLGDSGWIIVALMYVAATIFFAFIQVFAGTSGL